MCERVKSTFEKKVVDVKDITCKGAYDPTLYKPKQAIVALVTTFEDGSARVGCKFCPQSGKLFGKCQNVKTKTETDPVEPERCPFYKI